jgi:hypothetical protein
VGLGLDVVWEYDSVITAVDFLTIKVNSTYITLFGFTEVSNLMGLKLSSNDSY